MILIVIIVIIIIIMVPVDKVLPVTCLHTRPVCGTAGTGLKKQNQQHSLFVLNLIQGLIMICKRTRLFLILSFGREQSRASEKITDNALSQYLLQ